MPASTGAPWNIPSPQLPEAPDAPGNLSDLGLAVHAALGRAYPCTSTTRPGHLAGLLIYETDTNLLQISDGAAWHVISIQQWLKFEYPAGVTTDASGLATMTHSAPFTPTAVALIMKNPGATYAVVWGTDTYTATTFRARWINGLTANQFASSATGSFAAILYA